MTKESACNKILEDIVDKYNGVWPNPSFHMVYTCDGVSVTITKELFEDTAERVGYINGYKYGVEYPTNGKQPNLPDGIEIEVFFRDGDISTCPSNVDCRWSHVNSYGDIISFRITDDRYKPKEKQSEDWYKRGEHPPVGEVVEFYSESSPKKAHECDFENDCIPDTWVTGDKLTVISHVKTPLSDSVPVVQNKRTLEVSTLMVEYIRPIQSERDKLINTAKAEVMSAKSEFKLSREDQITIEALHNAGMLKLPEEN